MIPPSARTSQLTFSLKQILDGFLRLAAAHETPGALDSTLRNRYDLYTQYNIKAFLSDLTETVSSNGMPTYDWDYMEFANNTEEVKGIHALWDIYTVHECWQRNPTLFGFVASRCHSLSRN